ncbi:methyltransferase-like protein 7A, partial [Pollicipes pollicipes]|uniref:methyltransferase-like protein 7A n=1 Tax=Pollicipes pollicipes TaxID=41117 RepID=UPI001884FC47
MWEWLDFFLNIIVLTLGWYTLVNIVKRTALGRGRAQQFDNMIGATLMYFIMKDSLKKFYESPKKEVFASLEELKSADPELQKKNALNILEVGVGSGTNLEYYPADSRLLCVDPNKEFEIYFRRECKRKAAHLDPDIRFVTERGECMPSVADNSVDVVVTTLVLCCVRHVDQMIREIHRVLVPGGKYYFVEHVRDK